MHEGRGTPGAPGPQEILKLAVEERVDCLLLGGDLFHDNKPSRATLQRTMQLLTRYALSDSPVGFQVVSDQRQNFVAGYAPSPLPAPRCPGPPAGPVPAAPPRPHGARTLPHLAAAPPACALLRSRLAAACTRTKVAWSMGPRPWTDDGRGG